MPRYDFECKKCHHQFELQLSLEEREKDVPQKVCPKCSSKEVEQMISAGKCGVSCNEHDKSADTSTCDSNCCSTGNCPYK